jgi:hypothetical protein
MFDEALEACVILGQRHGKAHEFLPQRHWHRVLQLRAYDFHDAVELASFVGPGGSSR